MFGKQHLTSLFEDRDINIPVTIFNSTEIKDVSHYTKQTWFCTIKNSLGQALKNSDQSYHFQITSIKGNVYTLFCVGSKFIDELRSLFANKDPMSIRIDILEDYDSAWVIILKSDL